MASMVAASAPLPGGSRSDRRSADTKLLSTSVTWPCRLGSRARVSVLIASAVAAPSLPTERCATHQYLPDTWLQGGWQGLTQPLISSASSVLNIVREGSH
jgi:hypothetical protein